MNNIKFDKSTTCPKCFGKFIKNLPLSKMCDLSYIEKERQKPCKHSKIEKPLV